MERLCSHRMASCSSSAAGGVHLAQVPARNCTWLRQRVRLLHRLHASTGRAASNGQHPWSDADRSRARSPNPMPLSQAVTTATQTPPTESPASPEARSLNSQDAQSSDDEGAFTLGLMESQEEEQSSVSSPLVAGISLLGIAVLLGGGYFFKDQIKAFLDFFITAVDDWGAWGYAAYALVYIGLEVLAVPAIPLTMTAGVIFGSWQGTLLTSVAGTVAATIAFLIARYAVRDKVRKFAYRHPKFKAIDRAIGQNGLKFVTLLRLSPLLPLAASNYLYGLTSVDLGSYVLGSWLGMLPGTYAYVHAGAIGRAVLMEGEGSLSIESWQIALGLGATLFALAFVGRIAKKAIEEADEGATTPSSSIAKDKQQG